MSTSANLLYCVNKIKVKKNHMIIPSATGVITSKSILNQNTSIHSYTSQLGIEGNFSNFIKVIYEKPKTSIPEIVSIPVTSGAILGVCYHYCSSTLHCTQDFSSLAQLF